MNKFTKGPWTYHKHDNILAAEGGSRVISYLSAEVGRDERDANGHLIASAPELFAACAKLVDVCENGSPMDLMRLVGEVYKEAKEAIAKASSN